MIIGSLSRYFLVLFLGCCLVCSFPPHAISGIVFIVMTLFILGLNNKFTKSGFWYGYVFYFGAGVGFIGSWFSSYFRVQLGASYILSYSLTAIICLYAAIYIGVICYLYNKIKTKFDLFNLVVLFPSLWVLTELIRGLFFPRSWYVLGNIEVNNQLFKGYYPIFGVYFVSWIIVAIAGLVCYFVIYKHKTIKSTIRFLGLCMIGIILSYVLSEVRYTHKYGKPITVALLQPSVFSTNHLTEEKLIETEDIVENMISTINADLIILPETIFGTDPHYLSDGYTDEIQQLTKGKHVIFGSPNSWPGEVHQTGVASIDEPNKLIYSKHYLVPFGEYIPLQTNSLMHALVNSIGFNILNYIPGSYYQSPFIIDGQKFAFNICYENTINDFVAKNASKATILINQSDLSWYGKTVMKDASLQFSQARALENQRYFLQDGNTGDTVIITPTGEIDKQIPAFEVGSIVTSIDGYDGTTPFEYFGNIPIWCLCCISILLAFYKKIKRKLF